MKAVNRKTGKTVKAVQKVAPKLKLQPKRKINWNNVA
jgi:hypothetical protein